MIHQALEYVRRELSERLNIDEGDPDVDVMIDSARVFSSQSNNKGVYITLVNVGSDPAPRDEHNPAQKSTMSLNIHLLISYDFLTYDASLAHLSKTIALFDEQPVFGADSASDTNPFPAGLDSLKFSFCDTDFEELNNLWSLLGGTYLPSVLYEVKVAQARAPEQ